MFKRKFIPRGNYCYKRIKTIWDENGWPRTKIRMCDYYDDRGDGEARCGLTKEDISLSDQCKMCGKREHWWQL